MPQIITTRKRPLLHVLTQIYDVPWAITSEALNTIIEICEREQDIDAVAARLGRPLENAGGRSEIRNGIAILGVEGPIFRYANLFTELSGATSIEMLSRDFHAALDARNVQQILLDINSPGGQIDGVQEFADQVREGAKVKPVTAYIGNLAASAGYWIAAAAPRVSAAESALIGSVGVVAAITDNRMAQERQGVKRYEIVSSQSPYKRPDVATAEGQAQIQEVVDALADIFIGRLAGFRSVTADQVTSNFGKGKTIIARAAVGAGMIDDVVSFEPLVERLAAEPHARPTAPISIAGGTMDPVTPTPTQQPPQQPQQPPQTATPAPAPAPAATTSGVTSAAITIMPPTPDPRTAERQRIAAILNSPEAQGREALARVLAIESDLDPEAARRILAAAPAAAPAPAPNQFAQAMAQIPNPKVGTSPTGDEPLTAAQEAERILAFVPKANRRPS